MGEWAFPESRAVIHLALHIVVPGVVAGLFYRSRWLHAWLWMLAGWLIDIDHLLADPIYAPGRCSIGFHPLHSPAAIVLYGIMTVPRRTRLLGLGLLIHIALDTFDCVLMR